MMNPKEKPKKFLTPEEEAHLVTVIQEAEKATSGEIRVHVAQKVQKSAYEDAVRLFEKMGMTKTKERNGILIYLALHDHAFAVIGDVGIHQKVPAGFWDKIRDAMKDHFQKGEFAKGLEEAIRVCGNELAHDFPCRKDDRNELTNEISTG